MGIPGLTTFIQNRSDLYLDNYELHDCNVVVDGNAVACQLYRWHCKSNDCFGGDYDRYAAVVENFFQILSNCNVIPYVIFDGGYETRKVATIISRMKNRIKSAEQLNSVTEGSISVFPLYLRETFVNVVIKLGIKCVRCDFESDTESANISRALKCPVISYDSDFYIFDVLYIPFSTFELSVRTKRQTANESYRYISCKIYKIDKFLKSFGGLDKSNLPILAVLLGNDYVKRGVFSMFFKNLKMQKCHGNQSEQQKRIKSVIVWLQNESVESAICKVLSRYKSHRRKLIAGKISNAMKGYNCSYSIYLQYLGISMEPQSLDIKFDIEEIVKNQNLEEPSSDLSESEESSSESISEDEFVDSNNEETNLGIPTVFRENHRKCKYPPSFMDILVQNKYYCIPQVENGSLEFSHAVSLQIIRAIQSILKNSNERLVCIARNTKSHVKRHVLPLCDIEMPSLLEVQNFDLFQRKCLLLQVLEIDANFIDYLNLLPESWHLFLMTIKYLIGKSIITLPVVYALVLSKILLTYVNKYVAVSVSKKKFEQKIKPLITTTNKKNGNDNEGVTIKETLETINLNESLICLQTLYPYFHMDLKLRSNYRLYDKDLVHTMAQFQSCLLHVKYLNSLLNEPFSNFIMSEIFNGTFVYNMSKNFVKRSNLDDYVMLLLKESPIILKSFKLIIKEIMEHSDVPIFKDVANKKKRRKRKYKKVENEDTIEQVSTEEETPFDPNNKYSILTCSEVMS